jgi:hypothetical protein
LAWLFHTASGNRWSFTLPRFRFDLHTRPGRTHPPAEALAAGAVLDYLGLMPIDPKRIEVVDEEMAQVLRSKTGAERLEIAWRMVASARRMIASHLRTEHPDWDDQQIHAETIRRLSLGG